MSAPLTGVLVLDLSRHLPGPLAAKLLRDLGARVIKVEEPGVGDPVRHATAMHPAFGSLAELLLAGVESLALDLRREGARDVLRRVAAGADVLLETFRPGALARLDLAPEHLLEANPRLVVCQLSGFGQDGPAALRAGHDLTYQAVAGSLAASVSMPNLPAADLLGAWAAVTAILARLLDRQRSGRGGSIDASLLDAAGHGNLTGLAAESERERPVGEPLPLTGALPCYGLYATGDGGWVALAMLEPHFWSAFCSAVERPDLAPLQADEAARPAVAELIASRDRAAWQELFERLDLPAEAVRSPAESRRHPQVEHRDLVRVTAAGATPVLGFPALFDGERPRASGAMPAVGADTGRLLVEFAPEAARLSPEERRRRGIG